MALVVLCHLVLSWCRRAFGISTSVMFVHLLAGAICNKVSGRINFLGGVSFKENTCKVSAASFRYNGMSSVYVMQWLLVFG